MSTQLTQAPIPTGSSKDVPAKTLNLKGELDIPVVGEEAASPTKSVFDYLLDNEVPILRSTVAARDRANRMSSSFLNRDRGDGRTAPYVVMAFLDGTFPDNAPHNLPALLNIDIIEELTDDEVDAYVAGYGLSLQNGREGIKAYIGCIC